MMLERFKSTVLPLRNRLLAYARKLTDDPEDAEDTVQEVLLKLWSRREELEQYRNIEAYAMTLTHNTCIDMWRTKHGDNLSLNEALQAIDGRSPERELELKDAVELMHRLIDALPSLQRRIMRMKDVEGYETEEIAEITGCSAEAIRSNLSRARKRVRDSYLKYVQERRNP